MVLTAENEEILKLTLARDKAQAKLRKAREAARAQLQSFMTAAADAEAALKTKLEE